MISGDDLAQVMIDFAQDARLIERLTTVSEATGNLITQVGTLIELDPELGPEAGAAAEHLLEVSQAAERAATFVLERQRSRMLKLDEKG